MSLPKTALLCLLCCLSNFSLRAEEVTIPPDPAKFHLFLLVGQSNMAGRGKVEEQDRKPHPRVLTLDKTGEWVPAVDPLHFDKPGIVGVGLGKTFAMEYAEAHPDVVVGLIPCAVGGSPIASWKPAARDAATNTHPYDDTLKRMAKALPAGTLKGILWHQGESDATPELAPVYEQELHALIARFRHEFKTPEVPFIAGQMGQFAECPWNEATKQVDQAHRALPDKVPHTAFVTSEGLKHKGDRVHFDSAACRELGHRYFQAYQKLTTPN